MTAVVAGCRLSLGLLTIVPVGSPAADRATARAGMLWAPAVGAGLGIAVGLTAWLLGEFDLAPLLVAVLVVGMLAGLTRALHLDGLADTADGLGCGRPAADALAVMKASDIGPFGVLALMFAVLAQSAALATLLATQPDHHAVPILALACATARAPLALACRPEVRPARPEGLGALVAGTVPAAAGWLWAGALIWVGALVGLATDLGPARAAVAVLAAVLAAELMLRHCRRRFGGVTGDVLGALVETAMTVALVVLSTA